MNKHNRVSEGLDHAGEVSNVTPSLLELDGYQISSDTDVPSEEFLFRMFGKFYFPCHRHPSLYIPPSLYISPPLSKEGGE